MDKIIKKEVLTVLVTLFLMVCSNAVTAEEVTGIVSKSGPGSFELKKENGELIRIYTGRKHTKYVPDNFRTLVGDRVKIIYDVQPIRGGSIEPVAKKIESIVKGINQIDDIVCEINEMGRMMVKITLIDRHLFVSLPLGFREDFPKGYKPASGDTVSMYVNNQGHPWGTNTYNYLVAEIRKIDDSEKQKYLENMKRRRELWASDDASHAEDLLIDLNAITFNGIRNSAKEVANSDYCKNKKLTDKIAEILKEYLGKSDDSDIGIDAMAWCCIALHKSMNKEYMPILEEIKSSKVDGKIRKHAKKGLKALKKAKT